MLQRNVAYLVQPPPSGGVPQFLNVQGIVPQLTAPVRLSVPLELLHY